MGNIINDYERQLRSLSQVVTSKPLSIKGRALEELNFWNGRRETSSGANARLKRYWDNISWSGGWSPATPWSAAFISYILRGEMPGSGAHYQYVKSAIQGRDGWRAISIPKNRGKISLSVGDILVKPRSGSHTNSHGDVVYSISGGKAYLAGGNLGDSAKSVLLPVGAGQILQDGGPYLIVLKKNPKYVKSDLLSKALAFGGFSVALGLSGYLAYLVGERKGYWVDVKQKVAEMRGSTSLRLVPDIEWSGHDED